MPDKNAFDELKRAKEEEYFHRKEKQLIERIRQRAARAGERKEMGGVIGTADEEILTTLQELGYTRETVRLLYLVPLVQVAWASGSVTPRERDIVLEAANLTGVATQSLEHQQLTEWLDKRPDQDFFDLTLRVIRDILETLPVEKRESGKHSLVTFCNNIAAASGGILGFGNKVSDTEREVIERIASELERAHQDEARQIIANGS